MIKPEKELTKKEVEKYLKKFFGKWKKDFKITEQYVSLSGEGHHIIIIHYYGDARLSNNYLGNVTSITHNCVDVFIDDYYFIIYWKTPQDQPKHPW